MLSSVLSGLSIGSVLLLVALGLMVIYGNVGVINMAHGELVMLGAYVTVFSERFLQLPFLLCLPLAFAIAGLLGLLIERAIVRRLYGRLLDTLLATWGIGIILQQIIRLTFGPKLQNVSVPSFLTGEYRLGGVSIQSYRLMVFLITLALLLMVLTILYRTDFGTRLRAVKQNPQISACNGINVNRVRSWTFAFGAGLAGIAGVMVSGFNAISPTMGASYVVNSFIVVVVGGVSSLMGTVASSALLGGVNSVVAWMSNDVLAQVVMLGLAIAVIRCFPKGLFAPQSR
ncbi:MAG: High-affinity branched-chain amino acid transport system permease protein LivH [Chroococcidiopsis cubana SAG 39.79]|uniref:Branched-chain amino acid ABC transporter permease n=1 Tax=Chroococcidiopsis cubana SAG 39.79 TaxID=388085 RepID=A0AB37UEH7_9CYAN|nr:urea ABC transporter permease subunit UrtB [Chroococcidiopsis cubana]MDZ4872265.1 High-affinity branched-chain amino acid transport system permease protein LivH [Chroococcidiopsis cubana SAG 39.79]PSB56311.1 urea ABC transporter permease subunit UrtB [Chroococcidiopsis cubana CCALA 043]RUT07409.1 branched-chain amino acid ABC transporter permease [Chroococcidiopsis cubana SAG 39.79]